MYLIYNASHASKQCTLLFNIYVQTHSNLIYTLQPALNFATSLKPQALAPSHLTHCLTWIKTILQTPHPLRLERFRGTHKLVRSLSIGMLHPPTGLHRNEWYSMT